MIIRKPFAFIVEKFKLLHLIMLIPFIYLAYKLWKIMNFFQDFVVGGYTTKEINIVDNYFSIFMIISALLIILFSLIIIILFRKKKKNDKLYVLELLFNAAVLVFSIVLPSILARAQIAQLESSTSLIIRGAANIFFWGNIIAIIAFVLLMFGFDISSGEFLEIKDEINLDEEDSEEVEINIQRDNYKFKRGVRRYFREMKYYIIENKNIFFVLGGILGFIILIFAVRFAISLNRTVKIDQNFNYSRFKIQFNSSYLSTLDYGGNKILNGKVYLATKVKVRNSTNGLLTLTTSDFCLYVNNECFYPTLDRSGKFLDIAKPYYGESIGGGMEYEYALVYELDDKDAKGNYKIRILDSLERKNKELIPKYKEISLSPSYSDSVVEVGKYSLGEDQIDLSKTTLENTKLTVKDYELTNHFKYSYEYCYQDNCSTAYNGVIPSLGKYLLVLDANLEQDDNTPYFKYKLGSNDFFQDFMAIEYYIGDSRYVSNVVNKTPKTADKKVLEVNSNVKLADKINLVLTVRDKRYIITLKD